MKNLISSLLLIFSLNHVSAQKFWLTTYEFPGGPKTGVTLAQDSCLFVGFTEGVIRSCNEGNNFDTTLNASVVFTVYASSSGKVFAGGAGKIFYTDNLGQSWDSVSLNSVYPVTQLLENHQGDLFAITGTLDINLGFVGDGIFFSDDNGMTWMQRNNGLGIYTSMERIAIDKNGRLYAAAADEYVTGNGGLFISENNGLLWEHINISVDGQGAIPNQIKIANTRGLSVSPDDTVYFSFEGTAVNVAVQLNVRKSISDIRNNDFWKPYLVTNSVSWWLDRNLYNIHFAKNGDWYSSMKGSINTGATYFSKDKGIHWQHIDYGLGLDEFGGRSAQYFSETSSGKVFMVQWMDERVYWADTSVLVSDRPLEKITSGITLFPNPVKAGEYFFIQTENIAPVKNFSLLEITGKKMEDGKIGVSSKLVSAPKNPGMYFLVIKNRDVKEVRRFVVY